MNNDDIYFTTLNCLKHKAVCSVKVKPFHNSKLYYTDETGTIIYTLNSNLFTTWEDAFARAEKLRAQEIWYLESKLKDLKSFQFDAMASVSL